MSKGLSLVAFLVTILILTTDSIPAVKAASRSFQSAADTDWQAATSMSASDRDSLPYFCHGQYIEPGHDRDLDSQEINVMADEVLRLDDNSTTFSGDVVITLGTQEVRSPKIIHNRQTRISTVEGPLQIRQSGLLMTGEHAIINLFEGTGAIDQATFLLHQSGFRGSATILRQDKNGHIVLENAMLTRCEPGSDAWAMKSRTIELIPHKGYGTARDVTIRIKDKPLLRLPYMRFPLNDARQSGFLLPNIGYDSDAGADLAMPYYFNLAPHYDATYQPRLLAKRGLVHDGQFRWLTNRSMNEINAAFIRKDDLFDDRNILDQTSEETDTSSLPTRDFRKQDRWLLNVRHEGGYDSRWKTSISYSAISDQDYLHDIGGDVGASSVEQFINPVDSNFTNRRSAALDRVGQIQYRGHAWNLQLLAQGFQNLDPLQRAQYERLPSLSADWFDTFGPLEIKLDLEYSIFDKDTAGLSGSLATTGDRAYADIDLSWPVNTHWGFFKPSLGLTYRRYNLDASPSTKTQPEETTPRLALDAGLYFERYFSWHQSRIQQTLEPRVFYLYVEYDDQDDLPQFDARASTSGFSSIFRKNRFHGYDRLGDARQVGLGITTRLLSESTGAEFFSTSIGQIYYLEDRQVIFRPTMADDPTAPMSALFTQARLSLSNGLRISTTFEWEPSANRTNRGTFALKYRNGQRKILNFNYIYTSPDIRHPDQLRSSEESDLNFIWPVAKQWGLIGRWNFRWDDNRTIESFIGLEYNDCCWKSRLVIRRFLKEPETIIRLVDDPDSPGAFITESDITLPADVGIFFEFQLKGLARLGKRLDSLLDDAIPGYRERENLIGQ